MNDAQVRLTQRIGGYVHGAEGIDADHLTGSYCRGEFEATACIDRLSDYEDLEEQGKLLKLPCAVGDVVYIIPSKTNYKLNVLRGHEENNRVYHQSVAKVTLTENGWYAESSVDLKYRTGGILANKSYKETWFTSESEADAALQALKN